MKKISIINGPNLNLLGIREPEKYGYQRFEDYLESLRACYADFDISYFQSNVEGEIINHLHQVGFSVDGIILNAGGYTHTSVAIADAVAAIATPVVEVHITNILSREPQRHVSMIAAACCGTISGFGLMSYELALNFFRQSALDQECAMPIVGFDSLVTANRSYRRFHSKCLLDSVTIDRWLDTTRKTASGRNMQPLKYCVVTEQPTCDELFPLLKWAGYLPDWNPSLDESPSAYVVFVADKRLAGTTQIDLGIQAQTLLLAAAAEGFGGCIIMAFMKQQLAQLLQLPDHLDPLLVVALGSPAETCIVEDLPSDSSEAGDTQNIHYYRKDNIHHVPKRPLDELVVVRK